LKKLERRLGLTAVIAISIGSMLGSGIFVLPGLAFNYTGASVWLAYLAAAIAILPAALSKSELATAMPTSGGTYVYLERTFGPLVGTIAGLGLWVALLLKAAFALVGFASYLNVIASYNITYLALTLVALITFLNIIGIGKVSSFLIFIVVLTLGSLLLLDTAVLLNPISVAHDTYFLMGLDGFIAAVGLVFVSYAGVTKVAAIAEEIKDPERNLPRGILISLFSVATIYCFTTYALAKTVPQAELGGNLKPLYTLAHTFGGHYLGLMIAILAILAMTSMANAGVLAASRFPFAMSRDNLIPLIFGQLHRKFLTPVWSILASTTVIVAVILFLDVPKIAKLASAFTLIIFIFVNLAVIVLRETRVQWYKPSYKSPLYPFPQIIGIVINLILLAKMGRLAFLATLSVFIPGLIIFIFYSNKRMNRKGVLGIRGKRSDLIDDNIFNSSEIETIDLSRDASVVVGLLGKERSPEMLIEMGTALVGDGSLEVAHMTEAPEQTDLSDFIDEPASLRSLRRRVIAMAIEKTVPITFDPVVSHDIAKSIFDISQRLHCEWLLMEWAGKTRGTFTIQTPVQWLKSHLQCNLGIFRDNGVRYIRKILVIINEDHADRFVVDTADHLAQVNKADLTFAIFVPEETSEEEIVKKEEHLRDITKTIKSRKSTVILTGANKVKTIESTAVEFDLLIKGSGQSERWYNIFGTQDDQVMASAACSVLQIHAQQSSMISSNTLTELKD
jgi:APA family basic amino acid/polyamine antiporter